MYSCYVTPQARLADHLLSRAGRLAIFAAYGEDEEMAAEDALFYGNADADEAAKIFKQVNYFENMFLHIQKMF